MSDTGVRHLPVVDTQGRAVGILSDRDIQMVILDPEEFARSTDNGERHLLVGDVMSKPPLRVWASENCGTVAALFVQFRASAAPVVAEDGTLEGVVSYVDLLRSIPPASPTAGPAATTA
jgi:CBS domain-containing protein